MGGRLWTAEQVEILREYYPDNYAKVVAEMLNMPVTRVYHKVNNMGIRKSKAWRKRELDLQGKRLRVVGKKARFQKGHIPLNTGKKWQEWQSPEGRKNSLATAFKKGNLSHNAKYDGCVTIRTAAKCHKQYKYIRLAKSKWIELHLAMWIFLNGPLPAGKILRCKTEDTLNCDPSNWFLTDRSTHLAKNSGRADMSDKYIALVLSRRDPEVREALMQMPEILDLKRTELTLKQTINELA